MNLLRWLFGCRHRSTSRVFTLHNRQRCEAARATGSYFVCLECGREFAYSLDTMSVVHEQKRHHLNQKLQTSGVAR